VHEEVHAVKKPRVKMSTRGEGRIPQEKMKACVKSVRVWETMKAHVKFVRVQEKMTARMKTA
jgi:hypothetical protein